MVSNKGKPSIKEILSVDYWQKDETPQVSLWKEKATKIGLASMASILTGSGVFFIPYIAGLTQKVSAGIGIKCEKKIEISFSYNYSLVVLSLAISLNEIGKKIIGVEDTSYGSIIQAELPSDWKSFPGTLFFQIYDNGPSETTIIGSSIVKGQLIDWGKGKATLREVFDHSEQLLHKTEIQRNK